MQLGKMPTIFVTLCKICSMFADFCKKVLEEREKGRGKDARKKAKRAKNIRRKFSKFIKMRSFPTLHFTHPSLKMSKQTNNQTNNSVSQVYICNVKVIIFLYFDWFSFKRSDKTEKQIGEP